jgi:hypothetical protein
MASVVQVADALHLMAVSLPWRKFNNDEDETIAVAAFSYPIRDFNDDAVAAAANEWLATMTRFPAPMEFADVVRKHHQAMQPPRRVLEAGECANPSCDHGWVDNGGRMSKCSICGGPKAVRK